MSPLDLTWGVVAAYIGWRLLRKFGRLADRLLDPRIDRLAKSLDRKIASISIPSRAKTLLLQTIRRLFRLTVQLVVLYGLIWCALPVILARHLTLRQSVMLAEASLSGDPPSARVLDFVNQHAALLVSLPEPPRNALMLTDHQRLVGLGIFEDGPIDVGAAHIVRGRVITSQKAHYVSYHSKVTPLGKRVAFWRFRRWQEVFSRFRAREGTSPPSN